MYALVMTMVVAQLDGGAAEEIPTSHTIYLAKGNVLPSSGVPRAPNSFRALCEKVANGCTSNRAVWASEELMFELATDGEFRTLGLARALQPNASPLAKCLAQGMVGKRVDTAGTSNRMVCGTDHLPLSHVDPNEVARRAALCIPKDSPLRRLEITFAQVVDRKVVSLQMLLVSGEPALDLETEICVRRAASVPDFEFRKEERPPFERRRGQLILYPWYPDRPPADPPVRFPTGTKG